MAKKEDKYLSQAAATVFILLFIGFSITAFFLIQGKDLTGASIAGALPSISQAIVNTSSGNNLINENLLAWALATDSDGDNVSYSGFWYKDDVKKYNIFRNVSPLISNGNAIAHDSDDNVIIGGNYKTVNEDLYLIKYNDEGNLLWSYIEDGPANGRDRIEDIVIDKNDNIYATGSINLSAYHVWLGKFYPNGTKQWNRTFSFSSSGRGIDLDSQGNIFIASSSGTSNRVIKLDSNGNGIWNVSIDSYSLEDIKIDNDDDIVVIARNKTSLGIKILKFNSTGNLIWSRIWGDDTYVPNKLDIDNENNIYCARSSFFFGGGSGTTDGGIVKFNSSGDELWNISLIWGNTFGPSYSLVGIESLKINEDGNIFVIGNNQNTSAGSDSNKIYYYKIYPNSTVFYSNILNVTDYDGANDIDINNKDETIITGAWENTSLSIDKALLLKLGGFKVKNQTPSSMTFLDEINYSETCEEETWHINVKAFDGENYSDYKESNKVSIVGGSPSMTNIQTNGNFPARFGDNITWTANWSSDNCNNNLTLLISDSTSFTNCNFNSRTGCLAYSDYESNQEITTNSHTVSSSSANPFYWYAKICNEYGCSSYQSGQFIIKGDIGLATITSHQGTTNVKNGGAFNITARVTCNSPSRFNCTDIIATLDPLEFLPDKNISVPAYAHSVYADDNFIFATSDDSNWYDAENYVFAFNKTDLSFFNKFGKESNGQWTGGMMTVYGDSKYLYSGGRDGTMSVWNRTDFSTPFKHIFSASNSSNNVQAAYSDENYVYFGTQTTIVVLNKSNNFNNDFNLTVASGKIRNLANDENYLYASGHSSGNLYIFNKSNWGQSAITLSTFSSANLMDVDVDDNYIYGVGQLCNNWCEVFLRVWNKTDYSVVHDYNDTTLSYTGFTVNEGDNEFMYFGGFDTSWSGAGFIAQVNKSDWSIIDQINFTENNIQDIYCNEDYLYVATIAHSYTNGSILIFNNSCSSSSDVTINSITTSPSRIGKDETMNCSVNVTSENNIAGVNFTITLPDSTEVVLGNGNQNGDIWYKPYNTTVSGTHTCTAVALDNESNTDTKSLDFVVGDPGVIPMNSGSPFYTTSQNPVNGTDISCLENLPGGESCDITWEVKVNGTPETTWEFFAFFNGSYAETNKVNIKITNETTTDTNTTTLGAFPTPTETISSTSKSGSIFYLIGIGDYIENINFYFSNIIQIDMPEKVYLISVVEIKEKITIKIIDKFNRGIVGYWKINPGKRSFIDIDEDGYYDIFFELKRAQDNYIELKRSEFVHLDPSKAKKFGEIAQETSPPIEGPEVPLSDKQEIPKRPFAWVWEFLSSWIGKVISMLLFI